MALVGLLFAQKMVSEDWEEPISLTEVAGASLVERQIALAEGAGAERVLVVAERMPPQLAELMDVLRQEHPLVDVVRKPSAVASLVGPRDRVLVLDEALLADPRLIAEVAAADALPALGVWVERDRNAQLRTERIDSDHIFGGIALYDGELIRSVALELGDWDFASTLLRTGAAEERARFVSFDDAADAMDERPGWAVILSADEARRATQEIISGLPSPGRSWLARRPYGMLRRMLVRALVDGPATSLQLFLLTFLLALAALVLFGLGHLWWAIGTGLFASVLDGADQMLQRVRIGGAPDRPLRRAAVPLVAALWPLALGAHLAIWEGAFDALVLGLLGTAALAAIPADLRLFRRLSGSDLADLGTGDRRVAGFALHWHWLPWVLGLGAVFLGPRGALWLLGGHALLSVALVRMRTGLQLERLFGNASD